MEARNPFVKFKKIRQNVAQCRKKLKRGDPLVSSGFVGYRKKVKNGKGEGPYALSLHWPDFTLGFSGFRSYLKSGPDRSV